MKIIKHSGDIVDFDPENSENHCEIWSRRVDSGGYFT
jgi:hypothetical protein